MQLKRPQSLLSQLDEAEMQYKLNQNQALLPRLIDLYNHLGVRHLQQNKLALARSSFQKAFICCCSTKGKEQLRLSATLNNYACYWKQVNDVKQAESCIKRSLAIIKQLIKVQPGDPAFQKALADGLTNLGVLESLQGNHRRSLLMSRRASRILKEKKQNMVGAEGVLAINLFNQGVELLHLQNKSAASKAFRLAEQCCFKSGMYNLQSQICREQSRRQQSGSRAASKYQTVATQVSQKKDRAHSFNNCK